MVSKNKPECLGRRRSRFSPILFAAGLERDLFLLFLFFTAGFSLAMASYMVAEFEIKLNNNNN